MRPMAVPSPSWKTERSTSANCHLRFTQQAVQLLDQHLDVGPQGVQMLFDPHDRFDADTGALVGQITVAQAVHVAGEAAEVGRALLFTICASDVLQRY